MRRSPDPEMRCSVIIVTYNSADSISQCLEALVREDCEIVVVDNASQDDTLQRVQAFAAYPALQVLRISRNLGFAAAVNHGARAANGEALLLLNPDCVAEAGAVKRLIECMQGNGAAAAGGALLQSDGHPQRGFAFRRLPTLGLLLCEVLLVNQLWPSNPVNRRYRCFDADYSKPQPVEQPAGACLAIARYAFEALGGLDESFYPVWFEDVDFCRQLHDRGCAVIYCPEARFAHAGAHSVGRLSFREKQHFWYGNMIRYARKHFSRWQVVVLRLAIAKGVAWRSLAAMLGKRPNGVSVGEAVAAYADVGMVALGIGRKSETGS